MGEWRGRRSCDGSPCSRRGGAKRGRGANGRGWRAFLWHRPQKLGFRRTGRGRLDRAAHQRSKRNAGRRPCPTLCQGNRVRGAWSLATSEDAGIYGIVGARMGHPDLRTGKEAFACVPLRRETLQGQGRQRAPCVGVLHVPTWEPPSRLCSEGKAARLEEALRGGNARTSQSPRRRGHRRWGQPARPCEEVEGQAHKAEREENPVSGRRSRTRGDLRPRVRGEAASTTGRRPGRGGDEHRGANSTSISGAREQRGEGPGCEGRAGLSGRKGSCRAPSGTPPEKRKRSRSKRRRRRRKDSKSSSSSSHSSSSSSLVPPLQRKANKNPGSVMRLLMTNVSEALASAAVTDPEQPMALGPSASQVAAYYQIVARPQLGNKVRDCRELETLARCLDLLRQGKLPELGDALAGRFLAVESAGLTNNWADRCPAPRGHSRAPCRVGSACSDATSSASHKAGGESCRSERLAPVHHRRLQSVGRKRRRQRRPPSSSRGRKGSRQRRQERRRKRKRGLERQGEGRHGSGGSSEIAREGKRNRGRASISPCNIREDPSPCALGAGTGMASPISDDGYGTGALSSDSGREEGPYLSDFLRRGSNGTRILRPHPPMRLGWRVPAPGAIHLPVGEKVPGVGLKHQWMRCA